MKSFLTAFSMAWGMFSAIPCPLRRWEDRLRPLMLVCFPLVGLLAGALWALCAWLIHLAGGLGLFGAGLLTVLPFLCTGFIHLDGFMDCCDAILSRRDLPERQRILKDPHVGSFAVICVVILFLLEFGLFGTMAHPIPYGLLAAVPLAARCPAAMAVMTLRPMGTSSYAGSFETGVRTTHRIVLALLTAAALLLPLLLSGLAGLCAAAAAAGSTLVIAYGVHQLGGMSGDISGFAVTLGEFCGLLALTFL